ncbi:hypothetical protein ASE16_13335 [Leifsonia sp. Root227]|nr:hypothetical protein ASE16_13335 [Leifsonia sp. Root227]
MENRHGDRAGRAAEWLDARLLPILGPPPIGPYDPESPRTAEASVCPLCGRRIDEHGREQDHGHTFLLCPAPSTQQLQVS